MKPSACRTTPSLVDSAAATYADKTFISDQEVSLSFSAFKDACTQTAAALIDAGFQPGERAAIWAPNCYQWIIAALAIQYAGGVLVTINTRYKGGEASALINQAGVSILFCAGDFLGEYYPSLLDEATQRSLKRLVVLGESQNPDHCSWSTFIALGEQQLNGNGIAAVSARAEAVSENSISDILFTSGTTGAPKGVITEHGQNLRTFEVWTDIVGLDQEDRYLVVNPFFHSFGYKAGILACLMRGATLIPHQIFDPDSVLRCVQEHQITMLPGPPTLFHSLLTHATLDEFDISSLNKATTGAAVIAVELIEQMQQRLGIDTVITAYGLSECCGLATMCRRDDSAETVAATSGRALPGLSVRCVDSDGNAVASGEPGEIQVQGFNVMRGYFENAAATRETIDSAGWLSTGDVGILDDAGNLKITDRIKDMFICGGFNCYPAEIEKQMNVIKGIQQVAVIGVPDERMGEVAMACVIPEPDENLDEETVIKCCRDLMANYKVPRHVRFLEALPLNASGKVLKTALRAKFELV